MEIKNNKIDLSEEIISISPVNETIAKNKEIIAKSVEKIEPTKDDIEIKKEQIKNFIKTKKDFLTYIILAGIVFMGMYIRTRNISKLKDITTGTWTLGPDLDPFLFLRWAKYIVENGSLMAVDMMRNVPLGHNTAAEMKLLAYMIAWFHNILSLFSMTDSVTYSAIIFPVFMFGLTIIAFFLFARKVFYSEKDIERNIMALIATAIFAVVPSLLARTIAGIPEKESVGFFFIFMAFYFILEAFTAKNMKKSLLFGILSGIMTGLLALVWGGVTFVFMTIAGAVLISFIFGKMNEQRSYAYILWMTSAIALMMPFSERYTFGTITNSVSTGMNLGIIAILLVHIVVFERKWIDVKKYFTKKIPQELVSIIIAGILLILISSTLFGITFIPTQAKNVVSSIIHPLDVSRFGLTVAENKQPFFLNDWKNIFGPVIFNLPIYFWLFFIGSVALFASLISNLKKRERLTLIFGYVILLLGLIFSKYSPSSRLNGDSLTSFIVYFGGILFFIGVFGKYYFEKNKKEEMELFKNFNIAYILYFVILTMTIIGARGAIRLVMVLAAVSPVVIGFLNVKAYGLWKNEKDEVKKIIFALLLILIALSTALTFWSYYQSDLYQGENFAPGIYQYQWQNAMSWVRDNTSSDAVFAHWWDYGYWVQSIGERATILDGGNAIVYWNHLMGRHVLTGTDEGIALEFLYTHDATHLLIDSSELGKYTAYSSIGSDEDYDRLAWISTFILNEAQTQETQTETILVYNGGTVIDGDIAWTNEEGEEIFLPRKAAGVGAILVKQDSDGNYMQPEGVYVYNSKQYTIPLKKLYVDNQLIEFENGIDAGVFLYSNVVSDAATGLRIIPNGAATYLSPRTINSGIARYYLFNDDSEYFELVHSEQNYIVESLRSQGLAVGEFIQYQGFQGPIKIWEISYPENIEKNPAFLEKNYPNEELRLAKEGEY